MARHRTFCLKIVDDTLKKVFFKLGACVGRQPGYFLIVPALLTALCASGFQRLDYNYDPEYLISPSSGPAKQERAVMEQFFPVNYEFFQVCMKSNFVRHKSLIRRLAVRTKITFLFLKSSSNQNNPFIAFPI